MMVGIDYEALIMFRIWLIGKGFAEPFDVIDSNVMEGILTKLDGEQIDK